VEDIIWKALEACELNAGRALSAEDIQDGKGRIAGVSRQIITEAVEWPSRLDHLMGTDNWKLDRVGKHLQSHQEGDYRKKPKFTKIELRVHVNQAENLILEWRPALGPDGKYDYLRFSDDWYGSQRPENRILYIQDFGSVRNTDYLSEGQLKAFGKNLEAINQLIKTVVEFIQNYFEVYLLSEFHLKYSEAGTTNQPVGYDITYRTEARQQKS